MKTIIISTFLLLILMTCAKPAKNDQELFKGELFMKLVDIGTGFFLTKDENGRLLYDEFASMEDTSSLGDQEKKDKKFLDSLKKYGMLGQASIYFTSPQLNGEYVRVFMDSISYEKISTYKLRDLQQNNQKVIIQFYGEEIQEGALKCNELKSVKLVKGVTKWKK